MSNALSFISEHTAEYFLLSDIAPFLKDQFKKVIPFYYWAGREGSTFSISSADAESYRIIVVYPRRPKSRSMPERLIVKFNEYIWDTIIQFRNRGIPVLAGVPVASSFSDLNLLSPRCLWFELLEAPREDFELSFESVEDTDMPPYESDSIRGPIPKEHLISLIRSTELRQWPEIVQIIKESRKRDSHTSFFGFYGNYKPLFIICN